MKKETNTNNKKYKDNKQDIVIKDNNSNVKELDLLLIEEASEKILKKYKKAFEELAKWLNLTKILSLNYIKKWY